MNDEKKSAQVAAQIIDLSGGEIECQKLYNLMYIADRTMLLTWGFFITDNDYIFYCYGAERNLYAFDPAYFFSFMRSNKENYCNKHIKIENSRFSIKLDPGSNDLSKAEDDIILSSYDEWHNKLNILTRGSNVFPETQDDCINKIITHIDILNSNGKSDMIPMVLEHLETQEAMSFFNQKGIKK